MKRSPKLTDSEWRTVFQLRCRSKRGDWLSKEEMALVNTAHLEDPERYGAMEPEVFNATVPFGSNARHADTKVTCKFCRRSRSRPKMQRAENGGYQCRDEVGCSVATQWSTGDGDGH